MRILIKNSLSVLMMFALNFISTDALALSPQDETKHVAMTLSKELRLELKQLLFQGEVFSQSMSAWQIQSDYGFGSLIQALAKQNIIKQYHSLGHLIMLNGEYGQHHILLQLERLSADAYRGFLSVMSNQGASFSSDESEQFHRDLLKDTAVLAEKRASWLPESSLLLMDIKSNSHQSQHIYLDPMALEALQTEVVLNLNNLGWQKSITDELGFSLWTQGSQQLQLYFSQQAEGTALYVLTHDLTRDVYENTH